MSELSGKKPTLTVCHKEASGYEVPHCRCSIEVFRVDHKDVVYRCVKSRSR